MAGERYAMAGTGWARALMGFALLLGTGLGASPASAQANDVARQSRDDAWWTGPMLANSADTLPPGHLLIEPYFYDVMAKRSDSFGTRAYVLFGVTDRLTVGAIPILGYNRVSGGPPSAGIGLGDQIVEAQYRLTRFEEGSWVPTLAIQLQESLPTGKHDQLGNRPADGMGGGAYATTLGLNAQTYVWMPSGRILRMRLNVTETFSGSAVVDGVSVYGTGPSFHGRAQPGDAFYLGTSFEYSLTRRWVLALDLIYSRNASTRVVGYQSPLATALAGASEPVRSNSGHSEAYGYAPAVEYSWTPNLGVLLGARVIAGGHDSHRSVTPAIAINYVH